MGSSGVAVSPACIEAFNRLKPERKYKYIIFNVSDGSEEIVVEKTSDDGDYGAFLKDLPKPDCRYAVHDFEYEREGKRSDLVFHVWVPDEAKIQSQVFFSSSKDALRKRLIGIAVDIQATDFTEVSYESVLKKVTRGL
ncbi:hypothetical protein E2C00_00295 [Streptomyces sp. WAC05374]|uniref:actin-binding ADF family protein n=1 Tax=Streptomyces sp. WAC05374 TaxID=2487420 RepID=UPI000F889308|nr:actin depolymerization factor/cofilin-like domain-containing protein [Streptomyces sp. WAC05374]RST19633.1 hypothetical protein EF905_00650 [Streptomyces sp. WAC05374]TDF50030.1 hypothetical protein E2B92_00270 [Streptomyces sp. WAC05374]TDF57756.1 hypothetical protein E2C02_08060 [Streptomyces sp. WAC05374]TDF60284.1 hypothetical protein E2C00_00295 [Streptomyces sp. WAC05374]